MKPLYSGIIINIVGERNNEIREHVEVNSLVECSLDTEYNADELPLPDSTLIFNLMVREGAWPFVFKIPIIHAFSSPFAFSVVSRIHDLSDITDSFEGLVFGRCLGDVVDVVYGFERDIVHYKVNEVGLSSHKQDCD
jgi:hypothetical protein